MKLSNVLIGALLEFPIQKGIPNFEEIHFRKDKIFIFNTRENLKLDIESDIEFSIDAKDLKEVYSFVKTSPAVNFSLEENVLSISASNKPKAIFKYPVRVEDLPLLEELTEEGIDYEVDIVDKRSIIETASKFVGNDDIRPILSSVFINKEYIAATNAHYCYLKNFGNVGKDFEKGGTLFPVKYIKFLFHASKISNAKDVIIIDVKIDGVIGKISFRNDDGKYPEVYRVMPDMTYSGKVSFNGKELLSDLKIFQKLNTETTIVTIKGNEITFRAENLNLAKEYQNTYKLFQNNGVDAVIGVSPKYLQTILQNTDCSMLTIKLLDATKAFLFNDVLLMPVTLDDLGHVHINGRPVKEIEFEAIITMAKAIIDIDLHKYVEILYDFNLFGRTIDKKVVIKRKEVDGEITWVSSYLSNEEHLFVNLITGESKVYEAIIIEDTPEVEAIKNQMMDGPDSTDDGIAEMNMAIAADKSIEEQQEGAKNHAESTDGINIMQNEEKPLVTTDDLKPVEEKKEQVPYEEPIEMSADAQCPQCGEYYIHLVEDKYICSNCRMETPAVYNIAPDGRFVCPVCDSSLQLEEELHVLVCNNCDIRLDASLFDDKSESGLYEASGIDSSAEDEKMLENINSKATQETVDKIMGEIVEIAVSEEIKEKRRKQLLIGGFFLKDDQFNLEDKVFRPASILELSDEDFEVEMKAIFEEKRLYYLEKANLVKEKATKPGELPRSLCSVCGKYEWNKDIVDGKCKKCQPAEFKSTHPLTKKESYETKEQVDAPVKSEEEIKPKTEEIKVSPSLPANENKKVEEGGKLKMPWE